MATAWSDGAELDCSMAFNILLHQRERALLDASPHLSQVEKESLRTVPFGSPLLFDDLLTKLHLLEKVVEWQRENASASFPVSRHSQPSPSSRWTALTRTASTPGSWRSFHD